jgi:hypothetical protein
MVTSSIFKIQFHSGTKAKTRGILKENLKKRKMTKIRSKRFSYKDFLTKVPLCEIV